MMVKNTIQRLLRITGVELRRVNRVQERIVAVKRLMDQAGVACVLDVGANEGQFARQIRSAGWAGPIMSFEPLRDAHAALTRMAASDPLWTVAPRTAIGAERDTVKINVAGNSQSSSILPMLERHQVTAPESAYIGTQEIGVLPLDEAIPEQNLITRPYLLKMDVQGFESEVLRGASMTLDETAVVYCEMALQPLYEGEKLFYELCADIVGHGFRCAGVFNGHYDGTTGEVLQCDAVFVR
jgi:FkbM family methyltransferase